MVTAVAETLRMEFLSSSINSPAWGEGCALHLPRDMSSGDRLCTVNPVTTAILCPHAGVLSCHHSDLMSCRQRSSPCFYLPIKNQDLLLLPTPMLRSQDPAPWQPYLYTCLGPTHTFQPGLWPSGSLLYSSSRFLSIKIVKSVVPFACKACPPGA